MGVNGNYMPYAGVNTLSGEDAVELGRRGKVREGECSFTLVL